MHADFHDGMDLKKEIGVAREAHVSLLPVTEPDDVVMTLEQPATKRQRRDESMPNDNFEDAESEEQAVVAGDDDGWMMDSDSDDDSDDEDLRVAKE